MTKDDIIRMAQKARLLPIDIGPTVGTKYMRRKLESLQQFAELVEAADRERMKYDGIHTCHNECQRPACVATRNAVQLEREACAKICEEKIDAEYATGKVDHNEMGWTQACAAAIRSRSER